MSSSNAIALVQQSYDTIAEAYLAWGTQKSTPREEHLEILFSHVPSVATAVALELGCGAGVPGTQVLADRCQQVFANDISAAQIQLARDRVIADNVTFLGGDMNELAFDADSLDLVSALYSIIHVPREMQSDLFRRVHGWLKDGGVVMCNLAPMDLQGLISEDWLGTRMFWSCFSREDNVKMVKDAGFQVLMERVIEEEEDGKLIPFQWLVLRKGRS